MQAGAPTILIGPGNFEVAYAYDEWADIEEIIDAEDLRTRCNELVWLLRR